MKQVIICLSLLISTLAFAEDNKGFYIGAGMGTTNFEDDNLFKDANVPLNSDYDGNTFKVISGYTFNKIVSLELQYTSYGDTEYKSNGVRLVDFKHKSTSLAANVGYTFDNGLRPFGIIGISSLTAKAKGTLASSSDTGSAIRGGLGLEYTPHFLNGTSIRAAYEQDTFQIKYSGNPEKYDQRVDSFYIALIQKF